jgi:hypothetical protein
VSELLVISWAGIIEEKLSRGPAALDGELQLLLMVYVPLLAAARLKIKTQFLIKIFQADDDRCRGGAQHRL